MRIPRLSRTALAAAVVVTAALVLPAVAAPLGPPAPDPYPRVAFVARNDNPFDALALGPVAGALGGVVAVTPQAELSLPAATILTEYGPDLVVIAGGEAAISAAVEQDILELGDWEVDRAAGSGRDETARELARIIDELGLDRPAMLSNASGQNVGDLYIGGHIAAESATIGGVDIPGHLPQVWSEREREFSNKISAASVDEIPEVFDLEIDVPADGGVLVVRASAAANNSDETNGATVGLFLSLDDNTIDESDPQEFYDDVFALSQDRLGINDTSSQLDSSFLTVEVGGTVPVTAGIHHVYLFASLPAGGDTTLQIPSITATWYPSGTAEPVGYNASGT